MSGAWRVETIWNLTFKFWFPVNTFFSHPEEFCSAKGYESFQIQTNNLGDINQIIDYK